MPAAVTFSDIETRILEAANAEQSAPGFTTAAERARLINALYQQLWDMLVDARGAHYYAKRSGFDTVVAQAEYELDLPEASGGANTTRFMQLLWAGITDGTSRTVEMSQFEFPDLDVLESVSLAGSWPWQRTRYRVHDKYVELRPTPQWEKRVILRYVQRAPKIVSAAPGADEVTSLDGVNGWEEWMVLKGAIFIKRKKGQDTTDLRLDLADQVARIEALKSKRDAGNAPHPRSKGYAWSLNNWPRDPGLYDPDDFG